MEDNQSQSEDELFVGLVSCCKNEGIVKSLIEKLSDTSIIHKRSYWMMLSLQNRVPDRVETPSSHDIAMTSKEVLSLQEEYVKAYDLKEKSIVQSLFKPKTPGSKKFVKHSALISHLLFNEGNTLRDVAKALNINEKVMKECVRNYFIRSKKKVDKKVVSREYQEYKTEAIAHYLQLYLDNRAGQYTTVKMMTDYLRHH